MVHKTTFVTHYKPLQDNSLGAGEHKGQYYLFDETQRSFPSAVFSRNGRVVWFKTLKMALKTTKKLNG